MRAPTATIKRTDVHLGCACPSTGYHGAWDIEPCVVAHDPGCPWWESAALADGVEREAAATSPDLWLG